MQLRRCTSFYSLIAGNVRTNLENYLDGTSRAATEKSTKRRKKYKNGFLLHHGDNYPENPESPYKLHLATQVLLKLNKRRCKFKPKEEKGKSLLSYLKLAPKRSIRKSSSAVVSSASNNSNSNNNSHSNSATPIASSKEDNSNKGTAQTISTGTDGNPETTANEPVEQGVFSGEWTIDRKYVCNICGQVEESFWDIVTHKGEYHPGVVVTHVELTHPPPPSLVRKQPQIVPSKTGVPGPPACTKCSKTFRYIFIHFSLTVGR